MITAWRITGKKFADRAFSSEGAKIYGGRWNPPDKEMIYTAQSLSLAILELIVHLYEYQDIQDYVAIPVIFDEKQVISMAENALPKNWSSLPISDRTRQVVGNWLEKRRSLVLEVPSSVVPLERKFLINPRHAGFSRLKKGPDQSLYFDSRLADRLGAAGRRYGRKIPNNQEQ